MIDSSHNPHPDQTDHGIPTAYPAVLDHIVNGHLCPPAPGWRPAEYTWDCSACANREWFTFPDSQFPALFPHIDAPTVQPMGGEIVEAELIRPACPECYSLDFKPPRDAYLTTTDLELRGVTVQYVTGQATAEVHIDG